MNNVMMTLGSFQFSVVTAAYQELTRTTEWRWPAQERFMQGQALQYVGPGGDTIILPGVIYPEYRGGLEQLDLMRKVADKGEALGLISGTGAILGLWVIERIEEKQSIFAVLGAPRKQEFTLALRKFDSGILAAGAAMDSTSQIVTVGGVGAAATTATTAAAKTQSLIGSAGSTVSGIASSIGSSLATLQGIGSAASGVLQPVTRALNTANSLKASLSDAKKLLGSAPSALSAASSLTQIVGAANTAVANSSQAGAALKSSLNDMTSLGTAMPSTAQAVQAAMINVNKLTVVATSIQTSASNLLGGIGT